MNKRFALPVGILAVLAGVASAIALGVVPSTATDTCATVPGTVITHSDLTTDVRITGTQAAPQTLMTTASACFDGGPVQIVFNAEYLNHIPAPGTQLNGISFVLMIDGVAMERMALAGTHAQDNSFWPIVLVDYLDTAPRTISAGMHTIGVQVWKWSPNQDGYLKYSPGMTSGWGMPIRLTVIDM